MHGKPQRSCKATVKSTEYARAGNHEAVISRPMTLLLWEREPVDVLCIWRLSENNFAKLFSESLQMHKTSTGSRSHKSNVIGREMTASWLPARAYSVDFTVALQDL